MPRRRPSALRPERWRPRGGGPVRRIKGVSALTRAAIRWLETDRLWPGAVADALDTYRGFWINRVPCAGPWARAVQARDDLEKALRGCLVVRGLIWGGSCIGWSAARREIPCVGVGVPLRPGAWWRQCFLEW
jgi:hypothetical protein